MTTTSVIIGGQPAWGHLLPKSTGESVQPAVKESSKTPRITVQSVSRCDRIDPVLPRAMAKVIGLLHGHDTALTDALAARLSAEAALRVEPITIGAASEHLIVPWDVIVDRFSHRVPHYRCFLKAAALAGSTVINDPFQDDDRFFALSLARRLGAPAARAVLLPQHSYGPHVDHQRSLGNLEHPLRWRTLAHYVRLPALLRPIDAPLGEGTRIDDLDGLWRAFNTTRQRVTMLQQHVEAWTQVEVICVDFDYVLVRGAALPARCIDISRRVSRALQRPLNVLTWALDDQGQATLIDASDPFAAIEPFADLVDVLSAAVVRAARSDSHTRDAYRWAAHLDQAANWTTS